MTSAPEIAIIGVGLHPSGRHADLMKQEWPERSVVVDDVPMTELGKQIAGAVR